MISYILIVLGVTALIGTICTKLSEKGNNKAAFKVLFVAMAILFVGSIGYLIGSTTIARGGAESVAYCEGRSIYHDVDQDEYFVLDNDNWNPLKLHYRNYLDKAMVEEYIELSKRTDELDILNSGNALNQGKNKD